MPEPSRQGKKRIAQALMVEERYGKGDGNQPNPHRPKWKIKPKINPFKKKIGFEANFKF